MLPQFLNLLAEFLHLAVQTADDGVKFFRSRIHARLPAARLAGVGCSKAGLIGAGLVESGLTWPGKSGTARFLHLPFHLLHLALKILCQLMVSGGMKILGGGGQMFHAPFHVLRLATGLKRTLLRLARSRFHFTQTPFDPLGFLRATCGDQFLQTGAQLFRLFCAGPKRFAVAPFAARFRTAGFNFALLGFGTVALRFGLPARLLDLWTLFPFGFVGQGQRGECQGDAQHPGQNEK